MAHLLFVGFRNYLALRCFVNTAPDMLSAAKIVDLGVRFSHFSQ
uniref:Uncharacterized protein n=1 Tax=Anguilla anguilla TaxID=7936 RepID=A0A0E9SVR4_ANGAN